MKKEKNPDIIIKINEKLSDEELAELVKEGYSEAFDLIVKRYRRIVLNIAFYICRNEEDGADMAQEVFVKIYKNIDKFEGKSKFSTWVYRVAKNTCIDELKKLRRIGAQNAAEEDYNYLYRIENSPSPEEEILKDEFNNFVRAFLYKLPPIYEEVLTLRYIKGLSYAEIAEKTGCSGGTVKSRIYRGKRSLKQIIEDAVKNFMVFL